MEVRDTLYGAIPVPGNLMKVVDHPFFQRLRGIRQTGFSELPFPGATHTRYAHSLGAQHLVARAFDVVFQDHTFSTPQVREAYRECVRCAMLLHDIGHMPFSHCTEFAMQPLAALNIAAYDPERVAPRLQKRASHEDYTVGIITQSSLASVFDAFPFTAHHVASLVSREISLTDDFFIDQGCDYRQLLSQLISSELDCDRLDYLVRDSYYTGARYGQIDTDWLISNLRRYVDDDGNVSLAMNARALYAFDDFMIARYHMFVMVYFHHKSVVYEEMLKQYMSSEGCDYQLPVEMEAVLPVDDTHLNAYLRTRHEPFARRLVERRPYRRVLELHGTPENVNVERHILALHEAGIHTLSAGSTGRLSGYHGVGKKRKEAPPIYVIHEGRGRDPRVDLLEHATHIFQRYQEERRISRIYVSPEHREQAESILASIRASPAVAM